MVPRKPPLVTTLSPRFQLAEHLLPFLLAALLRHDQQEIKDGKNEKQREQA
jgi:hypothetical protein